MQTIQEILQEGGQSFKNSIAWNGVKRAVLYFIWEHRNKVIFKGEKKKIADYVFEFQRTSFEWIKRREPKLNLNWTKWLTDPTE